MSAKFFCDVCEDEISATRDRIRRKLGDVSIEIMVAFKEVWNSCHICDACVLKTVNKGKLIKRGLT